jgi:RND family efflux transporter MFP subunit
VEFVSPAFRDGGFFRKDEVLIRIEKEDYELARTRANALVSQAQARLDRELAEAEVAKKEWAEFGKGEAPALVLREPQLAEARAALAAANASLAAAELDLGRTEIRAWFDGRVRQESVEVGQFLMAGARVATVHATDFAEVRLSIPDDQLAYLDLPMLRGTAADSEPVDLIPVRLSTDISGTEFSWNGVIARTEAEVDPRTRVIQCVARVEDPYARGEPSRPPLMIGMYLKAEIPGRELKGIATVPRAALRGRDQVLVVDAENRIRWRRVEVLRKEGTRILIESGLSAGERVCLTDLAVAIEGMKVRVEDER